MLSLRRCLGSATTTSSLGRLATAGRHGYTPVQVQHQLDRTRNLYVSVSSVKPRCKIASSIDTLAVE